MTLSIQAEQVRLVQSWQKSPRKFVTEALLLEKRGYRVSNQQEEGIEEVRKVVEAKMLRSKGAKLTPEQAEYADKLGVSIMSGRGTGKDALAAWMIIWFLCCFHRPLVPCTATTASQLKDVLWREITRWLKDSAVEDWFVLQADKLFLKERNGKDWFAIARTTNPKDTVEAQAETLSGLHEDFMMIVIDEASAIASPVFRPLEGTMTGKCNFILMIFNPTRSRGYAVESQYRDRKRWACLKWNSEESDIVEKQFIKVQKKKYGVDSNAYRISVLGLPPHTEDDVLLPWDWVVDAVDRDLQPLDADEPVAGVDVGAGGDLSVLLRRHGPKVYPFLATDNPDSEALTGWLIRRLIDFDPAYVMIDTIGVGWGIAGNLRARTNLNIVDVNVSESASDDSRFKRLRDELWWRLREQFERRSISIPDDPELIAELTTIRFEEPDGKIKVESKKDMKRRGLESPNKADALCLTEYYETQVLRSLRHGARRKKKSQRDTNVNWRTV